MTWTVKEFSHVEPEKWGSYLGVVVVLNETTGEEQGLRVKFKEEPTFAQCMSVALDWCVAKNAESVEVEG